jgi:hypothetical protein
VKWREALRWANGAAALDGGSPVLLTILVHWPAASEPRLLAEQIRCMRNPLCMVSAFSALSLASLIAAAPLDLNSFANKDLRNADSNRISSLVRLLDAQNTNSAATREQFGPQPWIVWKLRHAAAAPQFLVFEGQRIFSIPGTSSAAVHVLDPAGRQPSSCTFSTGWRMDLKKGSPGGRAVPWSGHNRGVY